MSLWDISILGKRPVYSFGLWYLRNFPMSWFKEFLRHGVIGHSSRFSQFTNRDGIHFDLDVHECVQKGIFCFHYFEPEDVAGFRCFVHPGGMIFDVGANIGQYSLLASKLVGEKGHIYAFEPSPDVIDRLRHHLEINGADNVELVCKAAADRCGTAKFYPANELGNQGVGSLLPAEEYRAQIRSGSPIEVEVITLDEFCDEHAIDHIDVLKIDVEGFDLDVIKGAERVLARSPDVVVLAEVEPLNLVQRGLTHGDFIQYMAERGFRAYVSNLRGRLTPLSATDMTAPNLFFLRS